MTNIGSFPRRPRSGLLARACALAFMLFGAVALSGGTAAQAQQPGNGKVVFDLTSGNAKQMLTYLTVIEETRASMIGRGTKAELVLAFRGPATKLVQADISKLPAEDQETAQKIAATIKSLRGSPGIRAIEQCGVAVRLAGMKPEQIMKDVTVVENTWISIPDYQAKGFAYIVP